MASIQSKLLYFLLLLINKRSYLRRQLISGKPSIFDCPEPTSKVKRNCHVKRYQVNGRNVFTLTSKNKPKSAKHLLYLHGGAHVQSFNKLHWSFLAELIKDTGCTVTVPDFPLAPVATYKHAFAMVSALYRKIISITEPDDFILIGDSSGGGFALAVAQNMKIENVRQPNRIILLSPWLDLTLTNPAISSLESNDRFLEKAGLQQAAKLYAGETDLAHYLLSPINGSLNGLGRIAVFSGSKEILVADTRKLRKMAEAEGIVIDYFEYQEMVHAWMFVNLPESKKVKQQIKSIIQSPV